MRIPANECSGGLVLGKENSQGTCGNRPLAWPTLYERADMPDGSNSPDCAWF